MNAWRKALWAGAALAVLLAFRAGAAEPQAQRPFMLWDGQDIRRIQTLLKSEPWAQQRLAKMREAMPQPKDRSILENYFLYLMTGDAAAEKFEKQVLLHFAEVMASPKYAEGRSVEISAAFSIRNYDIAFRYDLFREALSKDEIRVCDLKFNQWSTMQMKNDYPLGWEHPHAMCNALLALGTMDQRVVRAAFEAQSGVKAYFDGMVDGCFSPEGCNPDSKMVGAMWLWCRGVERLGWDEFGFGYVGKGGGTMRRLMEGYFLAGDPRIEVPGGAPFYGRSAITLGTRVRQQDFVDLPEALAGQGLASERGGSAAPVQRLAPLRHPRDVFRAPLVSGQLRDGSGGWPALLPFRNDLFYSYDKKPRDLVGMPQIEYNPGVNPVSLGIQLPLVFELAHQRWADGGFAYFLSRMSPPEGGKYYPSLFWGLSPITLAETKPPAVKSVVFPGLGMALLRAEEGPGFWESPAPFAVLRLTSGTGDETAGSALALFSFQAFNRPLYRYVRPLRGTPARLASGRFQSTVVVDNAERTGVGKGSVRQRFEPAVKFAAVRSEAPPPVVRSRPAQKPGELAVLEAPPAANEFALIEGVEMERALALTREYLVDVYRVAGGKEHTCDWMVHALGSALPDQPGDWQPTEALDETLGSEQQQQAGSWDQRFTFTLKYGFGEQHLNDAQARTWSLNAVQTASAPNPAATILGPEWYDRKVGVRVTMLGEPGTRAFYAREVLPRGLTPEEEARLQAIRFPRRLHARDTGYDSADQRPTEIPIGPPSGGQKEEPKEPPKAKDFKPVGRVTGTYPETGGVVIVAERRAAKTIFVALHEPFEKMAWNIEEFRRIQQTDDAVAVALRGRAPSPVDDRILIRLGEHADEPLTVSDGAEQFTFKGFAHVRVGPDAVAVTGDVTSLKVKVRGAPKLVVNGQEKKAELAGDFLILAP